MKKHNFNSGPSMLPASVLQQAAQAVVDFNGLGLSILEIGHRTKHVIDIIEEARRLVKQLMNLNADYEVLFLQGGATTQFMQIPMNLLDSNETAAYCDNGIWGNKAAHAAKDFGNVCIVASSKEQQYRCIHKQFAVPADAKYLHITTNNTVEGTQWHRLPDVTIPLIGDMSSDIFSRPIDFNKFALIYAGAQKNIGAAGVTLVVMRKNIFTTIKRTLPQMMDYKHHIKEHSIVNTPPVFAIYVALLTLRWLVEQGGVTVMNERNVAKANLLYNTLESLPCFVSHVAKEDRSLMNAVFFLQNKTLEEIFLRLCEQEGMVGVKGYRTVGGIRVSMYNALPLESVQSFCALMKHFAQQNIANGA